MAAIRLLVERGKRLFQGDVAFRRVLLNSGWLLSSSTLTTAFLFLQGIIVARTLGVEQYGILTLITTYATTVNQFVDSRVWETVIKFVTQYREQGDFVKAKATVKFCYLVDGLTGGAAFLLLLLTANLAARLFVKDASAAALIQFYALSVIIAIPVGVSSALLRIGDRFDWLAYQNASVALFRLIGVLIVFTIGGKILGMLAIYLLSTVVGMVVLIWLSNGLSGTLGLSGWSQTPLSALHGEYKEILRFLFTTNGNALFKLLQRNADILLIGYLLTPTEVGYFRLARSMTNLMNFPVGPLYTTSYPEFARLWHQGQIDNLKRLIRKLTFSSVAIALPALLLIWLAGEWIIRLTVGAQYLPALSVLYWLALATALAIATNFGHPLLLAVGRASRSLLAIGLGVMTQLILLVLLLPTLGITAAGIGYLGFYIVWGGVVIASLRNIWKNQLQ